MCIRAGFNAILSGMIFALAMLPVTRTAIAAEWSVQPSARVGEEYSDNPLLTVLPHNSTHGSMLSPKLDFDISSDIWQVKGSMEAVQKRFSNNNSGLNIDDQIYNLMGSYNTERSTWQLAGSSSKSSTIAQEQVNPDTGAVDFPVVYNTHSITPSWTWAVDELTQLQLAYSFTNFSYVDGQVVGLYDYSARTLSTQITRQTSPNDQVFFSVGYSIFNVPSTAFESKATTYQAGITRQFSETLSGTLTAGTRHAADEQDVLVCRVSLGPFCYLTAAETQIAKQTSSVFNGSLKKRYETTSLTFTLGRSFDPSGLGGQVRTDSQELSLSRNFTSRLNGYFSVANYGYRSETGNLPGIDRHYYTYAPGLKWMWTEELSADVSYRYRHIKRANEGNPATSNSVYLILRYTWPQTSISR